MNIYFDSLSSKLIESEKHYKNNLAKIRAIAAHPSILDSVFAEYYGSKTPLNQLASIKIQDGNLIIISPFDKSQLKAILKGIEKANLGFNIQDDGIIIKIFVPQLTEEKRKFFVKEAKNLKEHAKVNLRTIRQDINAKIKNDKELSKDEISNSLNKVQKLIDEKNKLFEDLFLNKEKELLKV